jgi:UDP-glucose 4-epimerase
VDRLLAGGEAVFAVDGRPWNAENYLWPSRDSPQLRYFSESILNDGLVRYLVREVDTVYHLAAAVGLDNVIGQVLHVIDVNVTGTQIVLKAAAENGKRVLFTSTSEMNGKSGDIPFREDGDRLLGPTSIDRWVYSETKALGEYVCLGYAREGLPVSIVRLYNVYGPRLDLEGSGRVITRFLRQAMNGEDITVIGDGTQTRCFTYVSDIVDGILAAGQRPEAVGGIFNLGSDRETSINDLVSLIRTVLGRSITVRHVALDEVYGPGYEDIPRRVPDLSRARTVLHFDASVPLAEGIKSTADWLRAASLSPGG